MKSYAKPRCTGEPPSGRAGHSAVWINRKMFLYGGEAGATLPLGDLFAFDTGSFLWWFIIYVARNDANIERSIWSKPSYSGTPPSGRHSHASAGVGKKMYIFGGFDGDKLLNDLYAFDTGMILGCKRTKIITHTRIHSRRNCNLGNHPSHGCGPISSQIHRYGSCWRQNLHIRWLWRGRATV